MRRLLARLRRRACRYCRGSGRVLRFGSTPMAQLRACPICDDGRYLAETMVPTVQVTGR